MPDFPFRASPFLLLLLSTFYFLFSSSAFAAIFSVELSQVQIAPGDDFVAKVLVDTEGESLNAFEGELLFPLDLLDVREVRDGGSLVTLWLARPKQSGADRVKFSGITPGGYRGEHGFLFATTFRTKEEGNGVISLHNAQALQNDGMGTPADVTTVLPRFSVVAGTRPSLVADAPDLIPPEPFPIQIFRSPDAFEGKTMLVFSAQDEDSGIAYYEVCEGLFAPCARAESPHVLAYQKADRFLRVKAYDRSGNLRTGQLSTFSAIVRYALFGVIGIMGGAILLYLFIRLARKKL